MTPGLFITGTDTGVGKTAVTAGMAHLLRAHGLSVGVMKPIQTGCVMRHGRRIAPDARLLLRSAGSRSAHPGEYPDRPDGRMKTENDWACPYRFKEAVSPLVASQREGIPIDVNRIKSAYRCLAARNQVMLVEGTGGLLAPITRQLFSVDLALALGLPLLVVARRGLGTLNHTLLTVRWAQQTGATVIGVVFNSPDSSRMTLADRTNPKTFSELSSLPVLGIIPYLGKMEGGKKGLSRMGLFGNYLDKCLHHLGIKLDP